jgi:hypothetical protein
MADAPTYEQLAMEATRLRAALEVIEGGNVPGAMDLALAENWHDFATALQHVARAALAIRNGRAIAAALSTTGEG